MTTPVLSAKLDALPATLDLFQEYDAGPLAVSLADGARRHALSIGSGGSAIAAEYLARCRDTLIDIREFERSAFEDRIRRHPKVILRFAG